MIEGCHWCKVSLYSEEEKRRDPDFMGRPFVACADSEACDARQDERRAKIRDLNADQRLSAGQKTVSYYL